MIGSWNARGANSPSKFTEFKKWVFENKMVCFGLLETRISLNKVDRFCANLWPNWRFTHNATSNRKARVIVLWNPEVVQFDEVEFHDQYI